MFLVLGFPEFQGSGCSFASFEAEVPSIDSTQWDLRPLLARHLKKTDRKLASYPIPTFADLRVNLSNMSHFIATVLFIGVCVCVYLSIYIYILSDESCLFVARCLVLKAWVPLRSRPLAAFLPFGLCLRMLLGLDLSGSLKVPRCFCIGHSAVFTLHPLDI